MSPTPVEPPRLPPNLKKPQPPPIPPPNRGLLAIVVVLGLVVLMIATTIQQGQKPEVLRYSPDFVELVRGGEIEQARIVQDLSGGSAYLEGSLKSPSGTRPERFKVHILPNDKDVQKLLDEYGIPYAVAPQSPFFWSLISSVLPVVLIFGLLYFLFMRQMRSAGHSAMSFGKSRAKLMARDKRKVTFANVAGIDEAKEEVLEIIDFLKDPKKFQRLGGRIPKGVLLMGPPGTGKTLLAKAIAGEADVPFFSISGSDFVEMFVGVGASRVRDMFEQGKKNAPCILFIDEIDAVGRSRFSGIGGGHDEREQTLNALLVEMDGFDTQEGVIIVAATNRPDVLDPALLRPGRFDRQIVIDLPMLEGRERILSIHSERIKLEDKRDLRRIARGTPGFSGADLENLLNEAALLAARGDKSSVTLDDLEEARDKVMWGRERRSRAMDAKEKKSTAYHEAGHALVQQLAEHSEPLHKVTIIPRGLFLGATMSLPDKDRYAENKSKLLDDLLLLMGGRTAEEIVFGDVCTGARNDLKTATRIARAMVCDWGMSDRMGPQTFGDSQEPLFLGRDISRQINYSQETAKAIDEEISAILNHAHRRARDMLERHRDKLDLIATLLLERETLDGRDVEDIVHHGRILDIAERDEEDRQNGTSRKPNEDEAPSALQSETEPSVREDGDESG
jgi:cell division protease FtsH